MSFTTVTPLSKLLALICFVLFPFLGFYLGIQYQKLLTKPLPQIVVQNTPTASCVAQNSCGDEGKLCPDGTYVFQKLPDCAFTACPKPLDAKASVPMATLKKAASTNEQLMLQLSQKTSTPPQSLTIMVKNTLDSFMGGSFKTPQNSGWWLATKTDGVWLVTSLGSGTPSCGEIDQYKYPKTLVPTCKNAQGDITAR